MEESTEEQQGLLSNVNIKLGQLLHVVAPTLWLKLTRRIQINGDPDRGQWLRATMMLNAKDQVLSPEILFVRQLNPSRRVLAHFDFTSMAVVAAQRIKLIGFQNRLGFKVAEVAPEVGLGVDLLNLAPVIHMNFSDDDFTGYKVNPVTHPAVIAGAAGVYAAVMKYRFPLAFSSDVAAFKVQGKTVQVGLKTTVKRIENSKVATVGLNGVQLCINVQVQYCAHFCVSFWYIKLSAFHCAMLQQARCFLVQPYQQMTTEGLPVSIAKNVTDPPQQQHKVPLR
eukprot:TRINITY_DN689_c0_g4_i1.p1 TRINITY_DN689_c0_g4~~TRINITY_DN689_c0_g4_i1.p1  ORF type:complete len:281 (-),score=23.55 TRINITY_DN689_c0_g4_i1:184-1026(-)